MGCLSRVRILLGALSSHPLLLANMLVGGGFYVFGITAFYSLLQRFTVAHVVGLHGRFSPLKREKDPHPRGVRVMV